MPQKIYFLPGFGEDSFVFDNLKKHFINYQIIDVNYRSSLDKISFAIIDVNILCNQLIQEYGITKDDILIGHSMGGYFCFVIRETILCQIVMLASFSNPNKIVRLVDKQWVNVAIAKMGLPGKSFFQNFLLKASKGKYFEQEVEKVIRNFSNFSTAQISKMMKLSFGKPVQSVLENPLRIHAKNDVIVRPPDEAYELCTLGHFCLILETEVIANIILKGLEEKGTRVKINVE